MRKNFKTKHAYRIDAKGFCRAGLWYKFEETEVEKDEANTNRQDTKLHVLFHLCCFSVSEMS